MRTADLVLYRQVVAVERLNTLLVPFAKALGEVFAKRLKDLHARPARALEAEK